MEKYITDERNGSEYDLVKDYCSSRGYHGFPARLTQFR